MPSVSSSSGNSPEPNRVLVPSLISSRAGRQQQQQQQQQHSHFHSQMFQKSEVFGPSEASSANDMGRLREEVELLHRRNRHTDRETERQRALVEELRTRIALLEEQANKNQGDLAYAQQQLEFVVVTLERERGVVADHTEQLRLFAGETTRRGRTMDASGAEATTLLLVLANWLYMPVVHFAKGAYTVLSPVITTVQSLSLLNSEVLQRFSDDNARTRWGDAKRGDLLVRLQKGTLDPPSVVHTKRQQ